jgi:hypothetical protein
MPDFIHADFLFTNVKNRKKMLPGVKEVLLKECG